MRIVFLIVFSLLICNNVLAKDTIKPKKIKHCEGLYYNTANLCNRNFCKQHEDHRESYLCRDAYGINGCAYFNLKINFEEYYKKLNQNFGDFSETQCFYQATSMDDAKDDGRQIKCEDAVSGTQGVGDYGTGNCFGLFGTISKSKIEQLSSKKAFLNKKEQQKFCKHLKECSAIIEEVLRKEGKIK